MNKNILFIIPDERKVYEDASEKVGAFHLPSLAFAILGAIAKKNGFNPIVLDLSISNSPYEELEQRLLIYLPDYVGITCTSALYYEAIRVAKIVKQKLPSSKILIGGTHVSSTVEETLEKDIFDYVFIGEAEISFDKFLKGVNPENIDGIAFKTRDGNIRKLQNPSYLRNLDDFPFPDYGIYNLERYHFSRLYCRNCPAVWIETSRGCPFNCQICNKVVHGQTFRPKSVERVVSEMEFLLKQGIKEFHLADDGFTSDMKRAEEICDRIIERRLCFTWSCTNGIRADRVSQNLLKKMKKAGCYRISMGIESGNQDILNNLGKRISLEQVENAVRIAKKAGMEILGFFMFGFENETETTMLDTINFAKRLPLDLAKVSPIIPFPGSPLFTKYKALDLIYPTQDYRYFNFYMQPRLVYRHPSIEWKIIERYQRKFYRSFYFNPRYVLNRLMHSFKIGTLFFDLKLLLRMGWFKSMEGKGR
ncbi:MAG: radical SAM protein [Candidatus Omnitrophota bacterium]|nr:radical SAM protein [Candidatus Omnitrophota bacterium]